MKKFTYIMIIFVFAIESLSAALTPQAIAISDPTVKKIRQFDNTIWAVGRGISTYDLNTGEMKKWHQDYMALASTELMFTDIWRNFDGNIYLSSNLGIWMIYDTNWSILTTENSPLPSNKVNCMVEDPTGLLWIGTDKGLIIKNGSEWETENYGIDFNVTSISFDPNSDTVFICSNSPHFDVLVNGELTEVTLPAEALIGSNQISYRKVIKDRTGVKWIATYGTYGLIRQDEISFQQLMMSSQEESYIDDINLSADGDISGTNAAGFFKIDVASSEITMIDYNISNGLIGRPMTSYIDYLDNIWMGGSCKLIKKVQNKDTTYSTIYDNELMPGQFLNTFYSAPNGYVYIANYDGMGIFDTHNFKFYGIKKGFNKIGGIKDIATNSLNDVYIISHNQLYQFTEDSLHSVLDDKYSSISKYGLSFDSADTLWMTSNRHLWRYFEGRTDTFSLPGKADNFTFGDVIIDKNSIKWVKTLEGYYGFRDNKWIDSIIPSDIPKKIRTFEDLKMYADYNGDIWLASVGDIFKFNDGNWDIITSGENDVPAFKSLLDKVPLLSFVPPDKMYLQVDEKVWKKDDFGWKTPEELNLIYEKAYKLYVDINDNSWIYKADVESIAITMFREYGVYNSIDEQSFESKAKIFSLYPNPASNFATLKMNDDLSCSAIQDIEIMDYLGQKQAIKFTENGDNSLLLDMNDLPSGFYLIIIQTSNKNEIIKFIKE